MNDTGWDDSAASPFQTPDRCRVPLIVTAVIPGAKRADQVDQNVRPSELPPLGAGLHETLRKIYEERVRSQVHHYW